MQTEWIFPTQTQLCYYSSLPTRSKFIPFLKNICFLKILLIHLFLERGREGERKGEKHQCVVASHTPPNGDLAFNPGIHPDWELNQQPFGLQVSTQSTEPHQPEPHHFKVVQILEQQEQGNDCSTCTIWPSEMSLF